MVYLQLGYYEKSTECQEKALEISREIKDKQGEGTSYSNLGTVYNAIGEYEKSLGYEKKALAMYKEVGDKVREGTSHSNLGTLYYILVNIRTPLTASKGLSTSRKNSETKQGRNLVTAA